MSEKKWVRNSLRGVCRKLAQKGHAVSRGTVGRLLREMKFGLYSNRTCAELAEARVSAPSSIPNVTGNSVISGE